MAVTVRATVLLLLHCIASNIPASTQNAPPTCLVISAPPENIVEKHRMPRHVLGRTRGSLMKCLEACALDCLCLSINMNRITEECELNSLSRGPNVVLDENDDYDFFEITFKYGCKRIHDPCDDICCVTNPCKNGGKCQDLCHQSNRRFNCTCADGFSGDLCEKATGCNQNTCKNGGTCSESLGVLTCHCVTGYEGEFCEHNIDDCVSHPCQNNGTCIDLVNDTACHCRDGYSGDDCEEDVRYDYEVRFPNTNDTKKKWELITSRESNEDTDRFVVSMWVNLSRPSGVLFSYTAAPYQKAVQIQLLNLTAFQIHVADKHITKLLKTPVRLGLWEFWVLTWSTRYGKARLFRNGNMVPEFIEVVVTNVKIPVNGTPFIGAIDGHRNPLHAVFDVSMRSGGSSRLNCDINAGKPGIIRWEDQRSFFAHQEAVEFVSPTTATCT